jgi:hypothetical protein
MPARMNEKRDRYKNKTHQARRPGLRASAAHRGPAIGPAPLLRCSLPASPPGQARLFALTGLMPHASTCLALPRLALPQLNGLDCLHLRFPTCTCPSTVDPRPHPRRPRCSHSLCWCCLFFVLSFCPANQALSSIFCRPPASAWVHLSLLSVCLSLSIFGLSPFSPCSPPPIGPVFAS